jgi:hypothetical protein
MRNWSLVPSRHQNPFKALFAVYLMNSGAEEPREETNPHRKPSEREGKKTSVLSSWKHAFLTIFAKTSTNTEETRKPSERADLEGLLPVALETMQDEGGHGDGRLRATHGFLCFF